MAAPGQRAPCIIPLARPVHERPDPLGHGQHSRRCQPLRWLYLPGWTKRIAIGRKLRWYESGGPRAAGWHNPSGWRGLLLL